jgi:hypothetical protein
VTNLFLTHPQLLGQLIIRESSHLGRIDIRRQLLRYQRAQDPRRYAC